MQERFLVIMWSEGYLDVPYQLFLSRWWDVLLPVISVPFLVYASKLSKVYFLSFMIIAAAGFFGAIEFVMPEIRTSSPEPMMTGLPVVLGIISGFTASRYRSFGISFRELIFVRLFSWMLGITFFSLLLAGLVGGLPVGIAAGIYFSYSVGKWMLVGVLLGMGILLIQLLLTPIFRILKKWLSGE